MSHPGDRPARRRRGLRTVLGAAVAVGLAAGCQPTPTSTPTSTPVRFTFAEVTGADGIVARSFTNRGRAPVRVSVATADGGAVVAAPGRTAGDRAIRFPAFDPTLPSPRAVVRVANAGSGDGLDPGTGPFSYGADFTLDATSADLSPGSVDDGDNLVQRGRYDDRSQYKLEIDHRRPICRVKGSAGSLTVFAGIEVAADRWYRATCRRDGERVTVTVTWWNGDGTTASRSWSKTGPTGDLAPADPTTPLSLGGKLSSWTGGVASSADQFDGRLDNVFLTLG